MSLPEDKDLEAEAVLRPLFAAVAMHALLPKLLSSGRGSPADVSFDSLRYADALLARLREETP